MDLVDRLAVKLLARCNREIATMTAECLCGEPDRRLVRSMLADVRTMLDEFEDAYFEDDGKSG